MNDEAVEESSEESISVDNSRTVNLVVSGPPEGETEEVDPHYIQEIRARSERINALANLITAIVPALRPLDVDERIRDQMPSSSVRTLDRLLSQAFIAMKRINHLERGTE